MRLAIVALAALLAVPAVSGAADAPAPGVDWSAKTVRVKGSGAPDTQKSPNVAVARLNAERAAKVDAYRNALEQLKGVSVTSGTAAGKLLDDAATRAKVEAIVRGAKIVDTKYYEDGGVDVFLEVPLDGAISEVLLPPGENKQVPSAGPSAFSGLVIDARGTKVAPALAPRVLDEGGKEVYGAAYLSKDALRTAGVASYGKDLDAARKHARVGDKPLVVKALRADGSDLVLSNLDADRLRDAKTNLKFLADGKVVIVTD